MVLIALYGVVHIYQGEWTFYRRDVGSAMRSDSIATVLLVIAMLAMIAFIAWTRLTLVGEASQNLRWTFSAQTLASIKPITLWLAAAIPLSVLVGLCVCAAVRRSQAGVRLLVQRDKPLWLVFLLIPVIYLLSLLSHRHLELLVLIHVVGWWIFVTADFSSRVGVRSLRPLGAWSRIRSTQLGFQTFHGVIIGALTVMLLFYTHRREALQGGWLDWVLSRNAFYYWSVMHVTLGIFPSLFKRLLESRRAAIGNPGRRSGTAGDCGATTR